MVDFTNFLECYVLYVKTKKKYIELYIKHIKECKNTAAKIIVPTHHSHLVLSLCCDGW
jgi:hypothetical protein